MKLEITLDEYGLIYAALKAAAREAAERARILDKVAQPTADAAWDRADACNKLAVNLEDKIVEG